MKNISCAAALVLVFSATPTLSDPMSAQGYGQTDWSGAYLSFGLSHTSTSFSTNTAYAPARASGTGASLILGYNLQQDDIVYGAEVLLNRDRVRGSATGCGLGVTCSSSVRNYFAVRIRVGLSLDDTLVFGTLGYASDEQDHTINGVTASSRRHTGPTIGIGAEHALNENWSVRGDLEYYRLNSKGYVLPAPAGATTIRPSHTAGRLGLSYRF